MRKDDEKTQLLLEQVKQQQMFLEMLAHSWVADYRAGGGQVYCGKGCRNCCSLAVHTGFAEALAVARSLNRAQADAVAEYAGRLKELLQGVDGLAAYLRLHRTEIGFCPFLDQAGACGIYPVRPLSCRSLISTRESVWCGADFSRISPEEREAFLAGLDRQVVAFPSHYAASLQESGRELEDATAQRMRALLGFALYGNLGVLVHLCLSHGLADSCLKGADAAAAAMARAGFDLPVLWSISQG